MIVVAGTRRSGTSMWMQVFRAGGFPVIGEPFPRDWTRVARANPRGFFESSLREGINFTTNPDPTTGARLEPQETRDHVVKIFHQGIPLTERVWLDHVLVTVRDWRTYCASVLRLEAMERESVGVAARDPVRVDPAVEWMRENLMTLRDVATRGYLCRFVTAEAVLDQPERVVGEVLDWIGLDCDRHAAIQSIEPSMSARAPVDPSWVAPRHAEVYDALYASVQGGDPERLLDRLEVLEEELLHEAPKHRARVSVYQRALG